MKKLICFALAACVLFSSCSSDVYKKLIELQSGSFSISINEKGQFFGFTDINTGVNYLADDTIAPVLSIRIHGEILPPQSAVYSNKKLILKYDDEIEAVISVEEKDSHLSFSLVSISNDQGIDLIVWGPYPTRITKVIGETVGVVQGEEYAIGIQSLNAKTLGGYPWNENDCMPQIDIFDQDDYSDISEEGKRYVLYRVEAAKPATFGSTLQAYCRKRSSDRIIENWNHDNYMAPAFNDGGYIGSKIALFGCPVEEALTYLGKIELEEGLPH